MPASGTRGSTTSQDLLAAYIRDPHAHAPPPGIEPRRLKIYADLFYNNVEGLLASGFPVAKRTLGEGTWHALIRDFLREHPSRTPLFTELAREFLRYLESRADAGRNDPPWLQELAHYEWIELALQISEERNGDVAFEATPDLSTTCPVLSPLAWPLAYAWPVHRIGPENIPHTPDPMPTLLLVRRHEDGSVRFSELSALTFRLLQRIEDAPDSTGDAHLRALAAEASAAEVEDFVEQGTRMLEQLRADGVLLDGRPPRPA